MCIAQRHLDTPEVEPGIEPATFRHPANPLYLLSHMPFVYQSGSLSLVCLTPSPLLLIAERVPSQGSRSPPLLFLRSSLLAMMCFTDILRNQVRLVERQSWTDQKWYTGGAFKDTQQYNKYIETQKAGPSHSPHPLSGTPSKTEHAPFI